MNRRILLLFIVCLPLLSAFTDPPRESRSFSGVVLDAETKDLLTGVRVEQVESGLVVYTDAEGRFSFPVLSETAVLKFSLVSFCRNEVQCDISQNKSLSIELSPR